MKILLTGANGFIGRYLLARLVAAGHDVVPAVRRPKETDALLSAPASIRVDFNRDVSVADWLPRLRGIDAVINCAGVLQGSRGQSIAAIHSDAPIALFKACAESNVGRVIQISAISTGAGTAYAATKDRADAFLAASSLNWIVLRPSLVYAAGAYGGTALFRALAALPFAIPLIGKGDQLLQPIHVDDLAETVLHLLDNARINQVVIDPVGPDRLTLREILIDLRRWLGLRSAPTITVPMPLVRAAALAGDLFGGTINTTALKQLEFGNAGSAEKFFAATGLQPRGWQTMLLAEPAQVQDRQHARLYFLRPALRLSIAVTWLGSAAAGLIHRAAIADSVPILGHALPPFAIWAVCLLDAAIGIAVLARWRTSALALIQLAVVSMYSVLLTLSEPSLWTEPFGPLLKNIPFLVAVLVLAALERER